MADKLTASIKRRETVFALTGILNFITNVETDLKENFFVSFPRPIAFTYNLHRQSFFLKRDKIRETDNLWILYLMDSSF